MSISVIPINSGTGPRIAVDTVGTQAYQLVKIMQGAESATGALSDTLAVSMTGTMITSVVNTILPVATTIGNGYAFVVSSAVAISISPSSIPCKRIFITAYEGNTGEIRVGGATVSVSTGTETGIPLQQLQSLSIDIDNINKVYINAVNSNDGVSYAYIN